MARVAIPVVDGVGRAVEVELTVRRDTVECASHGRSRAVFDRDELRWWLSEPRGVIEADEVVFAHLETGIGVTVADSVPWRLVPWHLVQAMRERI